MEEKKPSNDLVLNQGDNTASWTFREEGDTLGQTYAGTFVFKCFLTPVDSLAASRLYRELLGTNSQEATENDRFLAFCLSQLKYRIMKAPPFWKTESMIDGNLPDLNILSLVLDRAISSEMRYKEQLTKRREDALKKAIDAAKALEDDLKGKEKKDG